MRGTLPEQAAIIDWLERATAAQWWFVLPLVLATPRLSRHFGYTVTTFRISADSAVYYLGGTQWVTFGRVPYLHLWDIKPPLAHLTAAIFAALAGGSPRLTHVIGSSFTLACMIGTMAAVMLAVKTYTGSQDAAFMAGMVMLGFPDLLIDVEKGYTPEFPFILCVSLVVLAGARRNYVAAATVAAVGAAFYQYGLGILLITLASIGYLSMTERVRWRVFYRSIGAVAGVALLSVLPFALSGALPQLIEQTIVTPLTVMERSSSYALLGRVEPAILLIGLLGAAVFAVRRRAVVATWPVLFTGWFILVNLRADLEGAPDLFPLSVMTAVAVGLAMHVAEPERDGDIWADPRLWLSAIIALWLVSAIDPIAFSSGSGPVQEALLNGTAIDRCHIRLSDKELAAIQRTGHSVNASTCHRPAWWPELTIGRP